MNETIRTQNLKADSDKTIHDPNNGSYECAGCTGQGMRIYQEDSLWYSSPTIPEEPVCAIIADGMGGMDNGAESSLIAKELFRSGIQTIDNTSDIPLSLREISISINTEVFTANSKKLMNGGTTLAAVYITGNLLYWISIGDSRIYLYRDGMLSAVNEEHELETLLYDMLLDGKITLEELYSIPEYELRKLTSCIGASTVSFIDRNHIPFKLHEGDKIIICSDGVSDSLSENEIMLCLEDPDTVINCRKIADLIGEKRLPHQDNYSAVVIRCRTENGK